MRVVKANVIELVGVKLFISSRCRMNLPGKESTEFRNLRVTWVPDSELIAMACPLLWPNERSNTTVS